MSHPIEDYAIIGDLHTVGLISRHGSLDWLCVPRIDSGAVFASLLGDESNGHWTLAPAKGHTTVSRRYRPETLILETEVANEDGTVRFTDFMPVRDGDPVIIRMVEGLEGAVPIRSQISLRFDYGRTTPMIRQYEAGVHAIAGPDAVLVCSPAAVTIEDHVISSDFTVRAGQTVAFQMLWHTSWEEVPEPCNIAELLEDTTKMWRTWSEQCVHAGPYRDAVLRSLITLKALTFAPSGGIAAAGTTSLPEQIGGERNWDYRYCWLRDSAVTLGALNRCGYVEEALAWRGWIMRAVGGDPSQMQIMYGIAGERRLEEATLDWLPGYENSLPVRIGNAAADQFQLDVYGELLAAAHYGRESGIAPMQEIWSMQLQLAQFVAENWQRPDDGIWEVRGDRKHFTHSKVMAWVAMDRVAKAITDHHLPGDAQYWRQLADEIHADVCAKGVDPQRNCFTQSYGSTNLDASLLVIPQVGFLPADDPRIINTVEAIAAELTVNGMVIRYRTEHTDDGLSGDEGTFVICTFWLVTCLAMIGELERAQMLFDRMLDARNDVGLLAEEYDSVNHRMLGNMPQAFSHVGLINAAHALQDAGSAPSLTDDPNATDEEIPEPTPDPAPNLSVHP